jgi:hypothetical protein
VNFDVAAKRILSVVCVRSLRLIKDSRRWQRKFSRLPSRDVLGGNEAGSVASQGTAAMERRPDYAKAAPQAFKALLSLLAHVNICRLEHSPLELVKIPGFENQRTRLLPRYAYQGCTSSQRK